MVIKTKKLFIHVWSSHVQNADYVANVQNYTKVTTLWF